MHTGPVPTEGGEGFPVAEDAIPNSQYHLLGEGREAVVDDVDTYDVLVEGTGVGSVLLEGARLVDNDEVEVFAIPGIPVRKGSRIEFVLDPQLEEPPAMTRDVEGDGTPDFVLSADGPPGPEVLLAVLLSAVGELDADTGAAGFAERTERKLRHATLRKALRALAEASEQLERGRSDEVAEELGRVRDLLERYGERLRREVDHGRAPEEPAAPLLATAADISALIDALVPVADDRDDDEDKDKDRDDRDEDDDDRDKDVD